ncbi:MAG: lipid-A-disaccharide synthase [Prevotella sp.]|nr:lipid-A-disaccharide synthase [Prevotella sp.]MBO5156422.1 lipid-A-disaccharide synthase [Prevotella sp.]
MKYYIIAGEASGDLHASCLMQSLKNADQQAEFRFFGGDKMAAVGGTLVKHYRELAYMGFVPVLLHLPTILRNMRFCKQDIAQWRPDVVILVDYPGFNLGIAKYVHACLSIPMYYYISPKIWAWKEYRIKNIRRDVSELFSILPFEIDFFEKKHNYPIHYVGNPTADEVRRFKAEYTDTKEMFCAYNSLGDKPIIALLAGSRLQEIKDNLPTMVRAAQPYLNDYQLVVAAAPSVPQEYYWKVLGNSGVSIVYGQTYPLLYHATAALVTSGTATLETALFGVPQVVCYKTPLPKLIAFLRRHLLKVKYISLVNLIANREVVPELVADTFTVAHIQCNLSAILPSGSSREAMLKGYDDVWRELGNDCAPDNAAAIIVRLLKDGK